jgi:hypothetical protein
MSKLLAMPYEKKIESLTNSKKTFSANQVSQLLSQQKDHYFDAL